MLDGGGGGGGVSILRYSILTPPPPNLKLYFDIKYVTFRLLCLFVCFVALRPKSSAMVMVRQSVHLTTLFSWASLNKQAVNQYFVHILSIITDNNPS